MLKYFLLVLTIFPLGAMAYQNDKDSSSIKSTFNISCISGRSTLRVNQLNEGDPKVIIYSQLISFDYMETYFDGEVIDGGRFIKIPFADLKSFIIIDTELSEKKEMLADLVWEGLSKEATSGHKQFRCFKK